jgi:hypothetical protein
MLLLAIDQNSGSRQQNVNLFLRKPLASRSELSRLLLCVRLRYICGHIGSGAKGKIVPEAGAALLAKKETIGSQEHENHRD